MSLKRKKVYDPVQRLLHAVLGLSVLILLLTAWSSDLFEKGGAENTIWAIHILTGYAFAAALAARLLWGLVGPRHARFSELWKPREAMRMVKEHRFGVGSRFGHHPIAGLGYLGVYALFLAMVATGLGLAAVEHGAGPLAPWLFDSVWLEEAFEEPHELISNLLLAFFIVHVAALILHERFDRVPIAQAMVSGYQYRNQSEGEEIENENET